MGNVRIMNDNYLSLDVLANHYVSSAKSSYPVTNLYDNQRRSKVWRSDGYYNVTSSNNTLRFQEVSGVNIDATLTVQEYTTDSSFLAEVESALESAGAGTYTVERDASTNKIKITQDTGTGFLTLVWTYSATLADLMGFDSSADDSGQTSYIADKLVIHENEWIKWDFGVSTLPKAFILIGPRNNAIKLSPSATFKLQGSETDTWASPSYEQSLAYDESVIALYSSSGLHSEALRYWRFYIEDLDNALGYIELGSLYLGDIFTTTRGDVQRPFDANYIDLSPTVYSEGGQSFSDERPKSERFNIKWFGLTYADKEIIDNHFSNVGTAIPFFISLDPNTAFSSSADYYTRFVKYEKEPQYSLVSPNNFEINMSLREEL